MFSWLGAALAGPALLVGGPALGIGPVYPGFGILGEQDSVPPAVERAVDRAGLPEDTGGRVAFNSPVGTPRQQYALVRRLDDAIASAGSGATVRMAAYSFAMPSTAEALAMAYVNGAHVQLVVDDHSAPWAPVRTLRKLLGTDTSADSFVRICRLSCRGGRGNQHAKFLTVSSGRDTDDTRDTDDLVMVGSMNLTGYSARRQWNDLYWVSDPALHSEFVEVFALMAQDRPQGYLRLPETRSGFSTDVSPSPDAAATDPIRARLRDIRCRGAAPGHGNSGRTVVRISMHAWNGGRGIALAEQVAGLGRAGCDVRVLYGSGMGRVVAHTLRRAGVPVRDSAHEGRRVHHKVMVLSGAYGGHRDAELVWTGSHNWSDRSLVNDEIMLRIGSRPVVRSYLANFRRIWNLAGPPLDRLER